MRQFEIIQTVYHEIYNENLNIFSTRGIQEGSVNCYFYDLIGFMNDIYSEILIALSF